MGQHQSNALRHCPIPIHKKHKTECQVSKLSKSKEHKFLDILKLWLIQNGVHDVKNHVTSITNSTNIPRSTRKCSESGMYAMDVSLVRFRYICSMRKGKECEKILTFSAQQRKGKDHVYIVLPCNCSGRFVAFDLTALDMHGRTPLHICVRMKDFELVRILLHCGVDPNAYDKHGYSPLHMSSENGDAKITQLLIDAGAKVNQCDQSFMSGVQSSNHTPLMKAVLHQNLQCMSVLLHKGADVNTAETGTRDTPLHKCCMHGYADCAQILLSHSAHGNVRNVQGITPLQMALFYQRKDIVHALVQYGCDVTSFNKSLPSILSLAAMNGDINLVQKCLDERVDVNSTDMYGKSALYYTVTLDRYSVWMHTYAHCSSVEAHSQVTDRNEIVELLIRRGAAVQSVLQLSQLNNVFTNKHFTLPQNIAILLKVLQATGFSTFTSEDLYNLFTNMLQENGRTLAKLLLASNPRLNTYLSHKLRDVVDWRGEHSDKAQIWHLQSACGADSDTASWINERMREPRSLQEWCRDTVRQCVGRNVLYNGDRLVLPKLIKDYVCLRDILSN